MRNEIWGLALLMAVGCSGTENSHDETIGTDLASITNGEVDGDLHPAVVLLLFEVGGTPAYTCTGVFIDPTTILTAGHCTEDPGGVSGVRVFTESDVENGENNFPFAGPNSIEACAWESHPEFDFDILGEYDVGVVKIPSPGFVLPQEEYGILPAVDSLDVLQPRSTTVFTSVGYGRQRSNPVFVENDRIRMFSMPHLISINTGPFGDFALKLSNNAATGGFCFGDSGGPNFIGDTRTIAGLTSFGNRTCTGTGFVFRLDRADVLEFINTERAEACPITTNPTANRP